MVLKLNYEANVNEHSEGTIELDEDEEVDYRDLETEEERNKYLLNIVKDVALDGTDVDVREVDTSDYSITEDEEDEEDDA